MNRKILLIPVYCLLTVFGYSQSWQAGIDKINSLCRTYDPYIRKFSYNENTNVLKWINKDGDIICDAVLSTVSVEAIPSGSDYTVTFKCLDKSKCINCTYGGPTDVSAITLTNRSAADDIVAEIKKISPGGRKSAGGGIGGRLSAGSSSGIDRINELCRKYDPYVRIFSYNAGAGILKWITQDGDITVDVVLNTITVEAGTSSVIFKCRDGSKCINCTYGGPTALTSVTINEKFAAEEIVQEIQKLAGGTVPYYGSKTKQGASPAAGRY
ncbi:MAG: hypothetical protein HY958_13850 [Bacteroidia bacterium]|nr:hypothetical protein [Bacteroidia bacterium]